MLPSPASPRVCLVWVKIGDRKNRMDWIIQKTTCDIWMIWYNVLIWFVPWFVLTHTRTYILSTTRFFQIYPNPLDNAWFWHSTLLDHTTAICPPLFWRNTKKTSSLFKTDSQTSMALKTEDLWLIFVHHILQAWSIYSGQWVSEVEQVEVITDDWVSQTQPDGSISRRTISNGKVLINPNWTIYLYQLIRCL